MQISNKNTTEKKKEDLGLVLTTHMVAHNLYNYNSEDLPPSSGLLSHYMHLVYNIYASKYS